MRNKKEIIAVTCINDYCVEFDFSSIRFIKRLRIAMAVIINKGFYFTGKEKNKIK